MTARASAIDSTVPALRIDARNDVAPRPGGDYVLYWMTMARRPGSNFALERAIDWARELGRPLVVFEALRCGYRWASDRLHAFILHGRGMDSASTARKVRVKGYIARYTG